MVMIVKIILNFLLLLATLLLIEGAMSSDNVIVISNGVAKLDETKRRWFRIYGSLISVFLARIIIPWALLYAAMPQFGLLGVFKASMSNDPEIQHAIHESSRVIVMGGASFLLGLFIFWWLEAKKEHECFWWENEIVERFDFLSSPVLWVLAFISSIALYAKHEDPLLIIAFLAVGLTFYSVWVLERDAERREKLIEANGLRKAVGGWTPVVMLTLINLCFSVDSIIGVFAFTTNLIMVILAGILGGLMVIYFTFKNLELIKKFKFIGHGGMYCVGFLAAVMLAEGFDVSFPEWLTPIISLSIIAYFVWRSIQENKRIQPVVM